MSNQAVGIMFFYLRSLLSQYHERSWSRSRAPKPFHWTQITRMNGIDRSPSEPCARPLGIKQQELYPKQVDDKRSCSDGRTLWLVQSLRASMHANAVPASRGRFAQRSP